MSDVSLVSDGFQPVVYSLCESFDRRHASRQLPMVTLDFELRYTRADEFEDVPLEEGFFCVDFWLN